jgi:uncharacterized protein YndB with AHSA1/START domain
VEHHRRRVRLTLPDEIRPDENRPAILGVPLPRPWEHDVRLRAEIRYDAEPATVFAMLTDAAFQEHKCAATGALESEVEIERFPDGGATIRTRRTMPTDQIPDFARSFVGSTLDVVQVEDLGAPDADGRRQGSVIVEIKGAPVRFAGSLALDPSPAGTLETLDGDIKASVPLVGGRLERALEPALQAAVRVEQREGTAWLARR